MSSPNMQLPIPVVGVTDGPDWATSINNCLTLIDQHDHTVGYGVQITPSGLNISADLPMGGNNLTVVRAVRFDVQGSPIAGVAPDLNTLYSSGDDLYFNDGNGIQIPITVAGAVGGAPGNISGLVAPASASYSSPTFTFQSAALTPANVDMRNAILRNNVASSFSLTISPPAAMATDYTITMPPLPASQKFMTMDATGTILAPWAVDSSTIEISGGTTVQVKDHGITQVKLQLRATGTTAAAGGVAISDDVWSVVNFFGPNVWINAHFIANNTSYTSIPTASPAGVIGTLSVILTTTGRPVIISIDPATLPQTTPSTPAYTAISIPLSSITSQGPTTWGLFRDGVEIRAVVVGSNIFGSSVNDSVTSVSFLDVVAAGTYTYEIKFKTESSGLVTVRAARLVAYET